MVKLSLGLPKNLESMQPLLDAEKARADEAVARAERAEALLRNFGCLV